MCIQKARAALGIIGIVSLFVTCGELDTVLPMPGTYQINALVNNVSLNECSLITAEDRIYPYFVSSVLDDPDVRGLMVFLQTPGGETVGQKIRYTLKGAEEPEEQAVRTEDWSQIKGEAETEAETKTPAETGDAGEGPDFPPISEETGETVQIAEPVNVEPHETETLVRVTRLDKNLPAFPLPKNLQIGQYTMVFHVLGEREILDRTEKSIYYLDNAVFSLNDIQRYLPDVSNSSHLIPPGITIMLEATVIADERLDPYMVWYNGKKRIGEGRVSDGAGLMLWKAPEQTGFHTIRVEAFPRIPEAGLYGKSREISIPVSSKAAGMGYFSGEAGSITHWYQFRGNLQDSKTPVATERALIPKGERPSHWTAQNSIYGLSIGAGDIYLLPAFSPIPEGDNPGTGRFMFRFKPVAEGTVFSVQYKTESPADSVYMDLVLSNGTLQLNITGPGIAEAIPAAYAPEEAEDFISLFIDFSEDGDRLAVRLDRENPAPVPPEPKIITLSSPLNGEGSFQFGASLNIVGTSGPEAADNSLPAEERQPVPVAAILDEFAAGWMETSLLPEEPEPVMVSAPAPAEEPEAENPEPDNVSEEETLPEPADLS
ncbi:MAG: hypothetical protein LBG10_10320 [Treponema sp.]|jgi:hypothetical protein|nr:hypothetical protein [Treponema sp.]